MKKLTLTESIRDIIGQLDEIGEGKLSKFEQDIADRFKDFDVKAANAEYERTKHNPKLVTYSDGNYNIERTIKQKFDGLQPKKETVLNFKGTAPNGDFWYIDTTHDGRLLWLRMFKGKGFHHSETWTYQWKPGMLEYRPGNKDGYSGSSIIYQYDPKAEGGVSVRGLSHGSIDAMFDRNLQRQAGQDASAHAKDVDKMKQIRAVLQNPLLLLNPQPKLRFD